MAIRDMERQVEKHLQIDKKMKLTIYTVYMYVYAHTYIH